MSRFHIGDRVIITNSDAYSNIVANNLYNRAIVIQCVSYEKPYCKLITDDGQSFSVYEEDLDLVSCSHEKS